jgi:hypothetical protein
MKASSSPTDVEAPTDDGVVVDVVSEGGVLYLELANLADRPAVNVSCKFEPSLVDIDGRDVSELALFRRLHFLAPRRRIRTLLHSTEGFFAREQPGRVTVAVEYERPDAPRQTTQIVHDLEVFRQLAYLA